MSETKPHTYIYTLPVTNSSKSFEELVKSYLVDNGQELKSLEVKHDVKVESYDAIYQIDVRATFKAFNCDIVVLVECKHQKSPIKRAVVELLKRRLSSTGAHKGIIFSTSKFQKGAIKYALAHGIALVRVYDGIFECVAAEVSGEVYEESFFEQPEFRDYSLQLIYPGPDQEFMLESFSDNPKALNSFLFAK